MECSFTNCMNYKAVLAFSNSIRGIKEYKKAFKKYTNSTEETSELMYS